MPNDGKRSMEQGVAATSTTVVNLEPAAPSTRSCDAFRSAAVHAGAAEIPETAGDGASVGPAEADGRALASTVGSGVTGATDGTSVGAVEGVAEQATRPSARRPATNGAAAR